jgi:hypothetical protein
MMERQQACNELAKFTSQWILLRRPICQHTRKTYYVQRSGLLKLVVDWRDGMVDPVFGEIKRPVVVTIEIEMD